MAGSCKCKTPWGKIALLSAGMTIAVPVVLGLTGVLAALAAGGGTTASAKPQAPQSYSPTVQRAVANLQQRSIVYNGHRYYNLS